MRHETLLFLSFIRIGLPLSSAQSKVSGDSLAADFHYLVKQLEVTHPDPYTGFGGKVFFISKRLI